MELPVDPSHPLLQKVNWADPKPKLSLSIPLTPPRRILCARIPLIARRTSLHGR